MRSGGRRRRATHLAAAIVLGVALAGCGSPSSPPTGVDGLTIPTPDPHAGDFVATIDNPWFPVVVGTRWHYDVASAPDAAATVVAEPGPPVAGVRTTMLVRTDEHGAITRDYYAQDRAGNVWWFGREGEWEAGVGGAEAGLAMPAHPRLGDGFRSAPDVICSIEDVDEDITVPLATYDDTVVLQVHEGSTVRADVYARGVGLVQTGETGLARMDEPRSAG